jgi:L-asparaginase II
MAGVPLVRVIRSGLEESVHAGDVAVVDGAGKVTMWAGDPDRLLFARSSMKPLQATVSLSLSPFDFSDKEVAVMCASHNGEPVHVKAVRSLMARAGVDEESLQCPAMRPWDDETAAAAPQRRRINSDCSGKHGGMLAACVAQGWPTDSYRGPEHPLQQGVMEAVLHATGLDAVRVGVDGCGVPVHGLPLRSMATIYARLSTPERWGSLAPFADRAVRAMRGEPYLVAGRNRVDTAVMQVAPGIVVKGGAEGLICAALIDIGLGVAVKVADGAHRAAGSALIHALRSMDRLDHTQVEHLASYARPAVLGGGEPVGEIQPVFSLAQS